MSTLDSPALGQATLIDLAKDIAERAGPYEQAADKLTRLSRDWEKRLAMHTKRAQGPNAEHRKATAFVAAVEQDDLFERLTDVEARHNALKVATKLLEAQATIRMSVLRSQERGG